MHTPRPPWPPSTVMSASCLLHPPPLPPPLSPLHALSLPRRTTPAHAPSLSRRIPHQPVSQPASQPTRPQTSRHTRDSEDCVPRRVGEMKMVGTRRPKVKSEQRLRPNNSKQDGACGIPKRADYVRGRVVKEAGITKHPRWMMGQLEFSHRRGRGASSGEQFVAPRKNQPPSIHPNPMLSRLARSAPDATFNASLRANPTSGHGYSGSMYLSPRTSCRRLHSRASSV
ncbi:hypothetical protein BKA80DRAFT_72208 [Phyllosticta citrichinensis]